tara:strand:- start:246 stop:521 length:276 start_codon:yes stop_codon:yes gene_type:complete
MLTTPPAPAAPQYPPVVCDVAVAPPPPGHDAYPPWQQPPQYPLQASFVALLPDIVNGALGINWYDAPEHIGEPLALPVTPQMPKLPQCEPH